MSTASSDSKEESVLENKEETGVTETEEVINETEQLENTTEVEESKEEKIAPVKEESVEEYQTQIEETPKEEPKPADEKPKEEKITIPDSFDPNFYASHNPDVVAAVGDSPEALYKHYQNYGKKEGRSQNASEEEAKLTKLQEEKEKE